MRERWVLTAACALSAGSVASFRVSEGLAAVGFAGGAGGVLGYALAARLERRSSSDGAKLPVPRFERWAPFVVLLFFVPLLTRAVAPGADTAMYAAIARAFGDPHRLSAAYGDVLTATYPRGFPALIATLASAVGMAKATLLAGAISYVFYFLGLSAFLKDVLRLPWPGALAAFAMLMSHDPVTFFSWGGNPNALAIGLGLLASAQIVRHADGAASAVLAALLVAGATVLHPIGATAALMLVGASPVIVWLRSGRAIEPRALRRMGVAVVAAAVPFVALLAAFKLGGPALSPRELRWIDRFRHVDENVFVGPRWLAPLTIWPGIVNFPGVPFLVVFSAAMLWELRSAAGRLRCAWTAGTVVALAVFLAVGVDVPGIDLLIYPGRFMPLVSLAMTPILGFAAEDLWRWDPRWARPIFAMGAIGALVVHAQVFQLAEPIATANDVRAIACLAASTPASAVFDGPYGDATQWIPALAGRGITHPHIHCTLFDEADAALAHRRPTYRFVGERLRYEEPLPTPIPSTTPLCQFGKAAAYPISPP